MPVFRVLVGTHCEGERGADGKLVKYRKGDVFRSKSDVDKTHNGPASIRFERLPEDTDPKLLKNPTKSGNEIAVSDAAKAGFDTLTTDAQNEELKKIFASVDKMDLAGLQKFAAEEEIDLGNLKGKNEILAQIKKSLTPGVVVKA